MRSYAAWCRKRGATAQCNPVFMVIGVIVAAVIACYIYRQVIIDTLLFGLLVIGTAAATGAAVALAVSTVRWYRERARVERARLAVPVTAEPETATLADEEAIEAEADWLASGVELAFSPDGKTLKAKTGK
jgi:hypothetical protein